MAINVEQFAKYWLDTHEGMDVEAEIPYYYDCYQQLESLSVFSLDGVNGGIIWQLLYVEDMGGLKLGKWNMEHYRLTANWLDIFVDHADYAVENYDKVYALLAEFIKHTPESGVKRYVRDAVLDVDFEKLFGFIKWYFKNNTGFMDCMSGPAKDQYLKQLVFKKQSSQWVRDFTDTDDAWCWQAKDGKTIIQRLADCFDGKEYMEVRNNLLAMRAHTVDAYRVLEVLEDGQVVIEDYKRKKKGTVALSQPLPRNYKKMYLVGDLVEWDKWYIPEPYAWIPKIDMAGFERETMLEEIQHALIEETKHGTAGLANGEEIDVYKDLYVL